MFAASLLNLPAAHAIHEGVDALGPWARPLVFLVPLRPLANPNPALHTHSVDALLLPETDVVFAGQSEHMVAPRAAGSDTAYLPAAHSTQPPNT